MGIRQEVDRHAEGRHWSEVQLHVRFCQWYTEHPLQRQAVRHTSLQRRWQEHLVQWNVFSRERDG